MDVSGNLMQLVVGVQKNATKAYVNTATFNDFLNETKRLLCRHKFS
jgi:hypothetical protein